MTEPSDESRPGFLIPDAYRGSYILSGLNATKVVAHMHVANELLGDSVNVAHLFKPPTAEEEAAGKAAHAAWKAKRAEQVAAAVAEWQQVRKQYADSPAVLAVLDIHQPDPDGRLECTHPVFGYEGDEEDWPCSTYEAIRDAVR